MHRPTPELLLLGLLLTGCAEGPFGAPAAAPPVAQTAQPVGKTRIGVLLPLSGPNATLGQSMLRAVKLASGPQGGSLDVEDTASVAGGAAAAAQKAVANDDGILIGPLTAADTQAAAAVAGPAGVPMLAFTSDPRQARPGVWVLGLTPAQQVIRLASAARSDGRSRFAAFLPENALGDAMDAALQQTAPEAQVGRHDSSFGSINDGLKTLSGFEARHGDRDTQIKADRASADPALRAEADTLAAEPVPPLPFDALLLADTGTQLQEVIDLLGPYDIDRQQVRIMGPALWGAFAQKLGQIAGAWYAAPDPAARAGFVQAFTTHYGTAPLRIDDFAFDAGALAAALSARGGFGTDALTRPDGFAGTDGVFALEPDGTVQRGLAVFQIDAGGGSHIVSPAPTRLNGTT